jgi:hypothetical protein
MKSKTFGLAMATLIGFAASAQAAAIIPTSTDTTSRSGWTILTFTAGSGEWTVPIGVTTVEVLVVGGGGSGMWQGGGGGGGGFYGTTGLGVTPGTEINVTVGAGGIAQPNRAVDTGSYPVGEVSGSGRESVFGSLIAYGGEGGKFVWTSSGAGYGQGGTSGMNNQNLGGGLVADLPNNSYGSGSGAGVKGTVGTSAAGGAGLSSSITGLTQWYGGGGGALVNGPGTDGGGNGANGPWGTPGLAGAANTGGGGGAGYGAPGGNGGTGIVIVAYQAIPEPSTCALVGIALVPLFFRRNRKSC